jgi:hypothetical protein
MFSPTLKLSPEITRKYSLFKQLMIENSKMFGTHHYYKAYSIMISRRFIYRKNIAIIASITKKTNSIIDPLKAPFSNKPCHVSSHTPHVNLSLLLRNGNVL